MHFLYVQKVLEEIVNADSGAPCSPRHLKKKHFIDTIKKGVTAHTTSKQLTESAAVACVKLCKISTYIPTTESTNVTFYLVQCVINDIKVRICSFLGSLGFVAPSSFSDFYLQTLLFSPTKPYSRGQGTNCTDLEMMIDCMVACFRITPHNAEAQKSCLLLSAPSSYHFVIVSSLLR